MVRNDTMEETIITVYKQVQLIFTFINLLFEEILFYSHILIMKSLLMKEQRNINHYMELEVLMYRHESCDLLGYEAE
jgi:hypothetical protein